jgi:hypothetical protein
MFNRYLQSNRYHYMYLKVFAFNLCMFDQQSTDFDSLSERQFRHCYRPIVTSLYQKQPFEHNKCNIFIIAST